MENITNCPDLMEVLGQITPLPEPFQQRVNSQLQTETYSAKTLLLRPGETCRKLYFIKSGFFRAYHIDQNGKEYTTWFMGTADLMISVHSFFTQTPAEEYIEVLQDSILQSISWLQLQAYYADFKESNYLGRIVTEKYYIQSEERALFLRTQSPEERYQHLLSKHPHIEQLTSTANIASYLGLTRETLSRLRSKLLRTKL
ncbi:MAG: Crp/Fnr family transcriptional regulator [Chitinophagaceae bacterium]|nr:MAG: Crp/Fnr family transcriptional regulator [Chitinophagaceae bacterium]